MSVAQNVLLHLRTHKVLGVPAVIPLVITVFFVLNYIAKRPKGKLPPGPSRIPILGNLHQLAPQRAWLQFEKWNKQYGPIVYLDLAGQPAIVIGTHKAAADLLDRRASIYSDRGKNIVAGKLLTGGLHFGFSQYNDVWRRQRRAAHEAMNNQAVKKYFHMQETESVMLVDQFLRKPLDFDSHLRRAATSLVLSVIYGQPPLRDSKDPTILRVNNFTERALAAAAPGAFLVEYFTWMEHLPRWMCAWRRYAEDWFAKDGVFFEKLFADVEKRVESGDTTPSVSASLIEDEANKSLSVQEAAWVAATLYAAGADTTSGQLLWWILAMVLFPEAMKKAQAELDRVVGRNRLPTFADSDQLPYIRAMVKETMRWRGVSPLAVPHRLCQDDEYEGCWIPKNTTCIVNAWALNRDKEVYGEDAEEFRPDRYLDPITGQFLPPIPDTKDEGHVSYGFGRRICVARHIANNSMFIEMASLLWCFDILPAMDDSDKPLLPDPMDFVDEGLVARPVPFKCQIRPRFPEVKDVIAHSLELHGQESIEA